MVDKRDITSFYAVDLIDPGDQQFTVPNEFRVEDVGNGGNGLSGMEFHGRLA